MILTGCDLETTGLKAEDGHQIIEIALAVYAGDLKTGFRKVGKTFCQRVKPTCPIDAGAQAVHGISLADLKTAPDWNRVAPHVKKILNKTDVLVAHNLAFDLPFLAVELNRAKIELPDIGVYCTMENGRAFTSLGKAPSLKQLCWACGLIYEDDAAHAADYDIELTMQCLLHGVERGWFDLSEFDKTAVKSGLLIEEVA